MSTGNATVASRATPPKYNPELVGQVIPIEVR